MSDYHYIGNELELFAKAHNWKKCLRDNLQPYLGQGVLEVGAGIGGTTQLLCSQRHNRWVCLEPDAELAKQLDVKCQRGELPQCCTVAVGSLESLDAQERFDTILYIDVLEHIENDSKEMAHAYSFLKPQGVIAVLAPVHQALFCAFDSMVGHYRRYNKKMFRSVSPQGSHLEKLIYLDSVGLLVSAANRFLLRSGQPTAFQIKMWDSLFVPCSRVVDRLTNHTFGKSILGIWRKPG